MEHLAVLVVDRIYAKTRRHIQKIRTCTGNEYILYLACVEGYPQGLDNSSVRGLVSEIISGSIEELSNQLRLAQTRFSSQISVVALNQSAIMPALALQRMLGQVPRCGFIASCDKAEMRRLLWQRGDNLAMPYCEVIPGASVQDCNYFASEKYIVKPAFGMSSKDVAICDSWTVATQHAESVDHSERWVPGHVMDALYARPPRTDKRIIEPYLEGTEFSIDGWINGSDWFAIVQHKLFMVQNTFIGDGPTVSPPIKSEDLPNGWKGLDSTEDEICGFGRRVLEGVGFSKGVFHIEGRELRESKQLRLIEINPRAPGGSLWRSALLRTGYDLEFVDASIQLGLDIWKSETVIHKHVLHYPFYADRIGKLVDWGDLENLESVGLPGFSVDFVAQLGDSFNEESMLEEPYLAFAVASDETQAGILSKCHSILGAIPPRLTLHCESMDK